ncbi:hypothetical protein BCR42DRAFT_455946 [Absidia repens]|uniref:Tc1-like transposase DDE domain-containing protein n=1 Tax=Absidia repens TaxID=90262 RepID=A0A1X2I1Z3_9FUNG|nr:hypothetical protein BCR42DRAFT_455946 [Absidia repens]
MSPSLSLMLSVYPWRYMSSSVPVRYMSGFTVYLDDMDPLDAEKITGFTVVVVVGYPGQPKRNLCLGDTIVAFDLIAEATDIAISCVKRLNEIWWKGGLPVEVMPTITITTTTTTTTGTTQQQEEKTFVQLRKRDSVLSAPTFLAHYQLQQSKNIEQPLADHGYRLLHLSHPYSPELNPIEQFWSKVELLIEVDASLGFDTLY